jgi:hypothetical protein
MLKEVLYNMNDTDQPQIPNSLLDRLRIPGETFRLPSQGLFYKSGELGDDVKNGEVEVYPMTAIDEIILNTPDKLLSGKAMTEVVAHCVPSIKKPGQLLSKDIDFLMACLRNVSFGPNMTITYTHSCEKAIEHEYEVSIANLIKGAKTIDPTTMVAEFTATMPNGQIVTLTPWTYDAIMELYQTTAMMKTDEISPEESHKLIIGTLTSAIKKVDDDSDKAHIGEWVGAIPLGWKKEIEEVTRKNSSWGMDYRSAQKCKDCDQEIMVDITPNPVSFFS